MNDQPLPPMTVLTANDMKMLLAFLQRVDLKGSEAPALVYLGTKLEKMMSEAETASKMDAVLP